MKKAFKYLLISLSIAILLVLFSVSGFAVRGDFADENGVYPVCKSHHGELVTLSDISKTAAKRNKGPMRAPSLTPATSDLPLAIIVIGFNDMPYSDSFNWAGEIFENEYSLSEFYSDMSGGRFTFTPARENSAFGGANTNTADKANDGVIHVKLNSDHDDWAFDYPAFSKKDIATNRTWAAAAIAAVNAADGVIDFSDYDTNGDGSITTDELALGFVVAGYEASSSESYKAGRSKYMWSHAWSFAEIEESYSFGNDLPAPDGVKVDSYIAISEMEDDKTQEPMSTLAHELGHYLGLPDLYDTEYFSGGEWSDYDVDTLSLMNRESWSDASGVVRPTPLDMWSKSILGWVDPETAGVTGSYSIDAADYEAKSLGDALKIQTQNKDEYYLLENRADSKWDAPMKTAFNTNGGILIWHIDDSIYDAYNEENSINNSDHRPAVMPLYPEKDSGGNYTFIGKTKTVVKDIPFFCKSVWDSKFSATLGSSLDLPIYGTGSNADLRSGRTVSGIKLQFTSNEGKTATVAINPDSHVHRATKVYITEPSCTEGGLMKFECILCGKCFTDESCTVETSELIPVNALGHTLPNSDGKCSRCGEKIVDDSALCKYCGKYHGDSFIQKLVAFFHNIFYFFAHLFGAK